MKYSYAIEKLSEAVDALVTGTGSIQERLLYAALAVHVLDARNFPAQMAVEFHGHVDGAYQSACHGR